MADSWQTLKDDVAKLEALHTKYTAENPVLEARYTELKKHVKHQDKLVVQAQVSLGAIADDARKVKSAADAYAKKTIAAADEILFATSKAAEKTREEFDAVEAQLDSRAKKLDERERIVTLNEKDNVAQSIALDETAKVLEAQAKEIADAAKVLDIKATDNRHEANAITVRSQDLDAREAGIAAAESEVAENKRKVIAKVQEVNAVIVSNRDKEVRLDSRDHELSIRENGILNREKELNKREKQLNDRARIDRFNA